MGWESDQNTAESVEQTTDRSKWVFAGIGVMILVMIAVLFSKKDNKNYNSAVRVQHILRVAPGGDLVAREKAYEEILDIKRQLDDGASFEQLAIEHSQDEANASIGGELGWFEHDETVLEFDAYLWTGEVGGVSYPVETAFGFHLIKILERNISDAEVYELNLNERVNRINQ